MIRAKIRAKTSKSQTKGRGKRMINVTGSVRQFLFSILLVVVATTLTACQTSYPTKEQVKDVDMIGVSHAAAEKMISQSAGRLESGNLLVASFANINDLEKSSTFGRTVAQQIASVFSKKGYKIVEMRLRDAVYIATTEGEFLLSRNLSKIGDDHDAEAVIAGTYSVGSKKVYVTAKLIRAKDSIVLAAEDFVLPLGPDLKTLVKQ